MTHLEVNHDGYPTHRRKVRFDWSNTPLHWVPGDPFATHMLNVFHLDAAGEQSPAARAARKPPDAQLPGSDG